MMGVGDMGGERRCRGGSMILVGDASPPPLLLLELVLPALWGWAWSDDRYSSCAAVRTAAGARCA